MKLNIPAKNKVTKTKKNQTTKSDGILMGDVLDEWEVTDENHIITVRNNRNDLVAIVKRHFGVSVVSAYEVNGILMRGKGTRHLGGAELAVIRGFYPDEE